MGKTSGGVRNINRVENPDIQRVKRGLLVYSKIDKWNRNTNYRLGFNDDAHSVIDDVADNNWGFASEVAKTVRKYNYRISEKQAYIIAKAAVENKSTFLWESNNKELKIIFKKTK